MSDFKGDNKWGIILGGSSGMGLASAKKLAQHGLNLIIIHKDRKTQTEAAEKMFEELRSLGVQLLSFNKDGVDASSIKELVEGIDAHLKQKEGQVHLVLHSIARGNLKPLFKNIEDIESTIEHDEISKFFELKNSGAPTGALSLTDFDLTLHSMALSLHTWVKELLDRDLFSTNSRIIGLTSEGDKKVWGSYAAVGAAKTVLESLVKYMAIELAPKKITANLIQAGVTETQSFRMIPGSDFLATFSKERNPNKRLTTPEDVANVVYLLSKEEANWINGTTIIADGGENLV
ncbi:MAG: SDR family oxidoreductase [Balneola sp.]|nr:MAG: SDR family oxidoreductase [Balneola sp.]